MPKRKVLIVEDEPAIQKLLTKELVTHHLDVINAFDGKAGLELALSTHPDIILLDIVLPVLDGLVFLEQLRTDVWGKTASVIILTNLSDPKRLAQAKALGVSEYLIKSHIETHAVAKKVIDFTSHLS